MTVDTRNGTAPVPVAQVKDLSVRFPSSDEPAVSGVSFSVAAGQCVALVGESGAGKSVTARSLIGLSGNGAHIDAARLALNGRDLRTLSERSWREIRGSQVGLVLQDALTSLDPLQTVHSAIAEVLRTHSHTPRDHVGDRVIELLTQVGIPNPEMRAAQHPLELSGGLRQRALIASAIAADPTLIIADEPTTALDASVQRQIIELLRERKRAGAGLLLVSHDLALVAEIADEIVVMRDGQVVEHGPASAVLDAPASAYTRQLLAAVPDAESRGKRLYLSDADAAAGHSPAPLPAHTVTDEVVLRVTDVNKAYRGPGGTTISAAQEVDFTLFSGETLGIVGESGSGKSTVASLVLGLTKPDSGHIELEEQPWSQIRESQRQARRRRLQLISQDPLSSFDPRYTVEKVLAEALPRSAKAQERREQISGSLRQVALAPDIASRSPRALSGGQRQRVAIARALLTEPRVVVCDEAVSALDVSVQAQILDLLAELSAERGLSLLFISHDLGVIRHATDRVLVMQGGRVIEEGDTSAVLSTPRHSYTKALIESVPALT